MKLTKYLAATVLMTASSVALSATIWTPTNEDTDFIQFDFAGITTNGGTLALFDDVRLWWYCPGDWFSWW